MSDNTDTQDNQPDDSAVIKELRAQLKEAQREYRDAEQRVRDKINRENKARDVLPAEYKGLADYLVQEVDGDLSPEVAKEWLQERGLVASSEGVQEEVKTPAEKAQALQDVTDLGSAVAAAGSTTAGNRFEDRLQEETSNIRGAGNLPSMAARIEQILSEEGAL